MQQTSKYQFNLVESGDAFTPAPLNENMEKVEEALGQVVTDLGSGGQNARIAFGSYAGTGAYGAATPLTLTFGFQPLAVFIADSARYAAYLLIYSNPTSQSITGSHTATLTWGESSLSLYASSAVGQMNNAGCTYYYVAVGA